MHDLYMSFINYLLLSIEHLLHLYTNESSFSNQGTLLNTVGTINRKWKPNQRDATWCTGQTLVKQAIEKITFIRQGCSEMNHIKISVVFVLFIHFFMFIDFTTDLLFLVLV